MYKNDEKFIEVNAGREQKGKKVKNSFGGDHKRDFFTRSTININKNILCMQ